MIKKDYLLRMIQEIVALIVNALLNKKQMKEQEWKEYDDLTMQILGFPTSQLMEMETEEIIGRYQDQPDQWEKIELAALTLLKLSDEMESGHLVLKTRLRQKGIELLEQVQAHSPTFSLPRIQLLEMLKREI